MKKPPVHKISQRYGSYVDLVQAILVDYQFMEEGLRMFLSLSYEQIRSHLPASVAFNFSYADTEKDALGTLIAKFDKFTYDAAFVQKLRDLVRYRNEIAHRAYLLSPQQQEDSKFLSSQIKSLRDIRKQLIPVIKRIYKDGMAIEKLIFRRN